MSKYRKEVGGFFYAINFLGKNYFGLCQLIILHQKLFWRRNYFGAKIILAQKLFLRKKCIFGEKNCAVKKCFWCKMINWHNKFGVKNFG